MEEKIKMGRNFVETPTAELHPFQSLQKQYCILGFSTTSEFFPAFKRAGKQ